MSEGQTLRSVFVDTSAHAALFIQRDERHHQARLIADVLGAKDRPLVSTNSVIAETHALILRREGRAVARSALTVLDETITVVHVTEADERAGRAILDRYADKNFSLTDAISFAVMDRLRLRTAFAFDRHFAQYGLDVLMAE